MVIGRNDNRQEITDQGGFFGKIFRFRMPVVPERRTEIISQRGQMLQ
jgi:hypothetical protein